MIGVLLGIIVVLTGLLAISISNGMSWANRYHAAQTERIDIHQRLYDMQQERIEEMQTERDERKWF